MNYFSPEMQTQDVNKISMLGLAHVGDAVYELLTRTMLCERGHSSVSELHRLTVSMVNAPAQARAAERLVPVLTDDELSVYRRGRNTKVNSVPHNADIGQYHAATGVEALFGWLYLQGRLERIEELFGLITGKEE
ncbi:MAG: ribonuclease III domain-containing protein [Eubacteriales bacterium]|nr:ribonuclease III domain-containing protein [Eubacteriales bacterium]